MNEPGSSSGEVSASPTPPVSPPVQTPTPTPVPPVTPPTPVQTPTPTPVPAPVPTPVLGREQVAHVASLARLSLSEEELDLFTGQLATVLAHARDVASLDLSGLAPTAHPLPIANVLRADEPDPGSDRSVVLAAAPEVEDHRFRVPRIVGEAP